MGIKHGVVLAAATGLALASSAASAQTRPAGSDATVQVVASNLNTPRGLIYDAANQRILVAEAGNDAGNTGPCGVGEAGGTLCFGNTGAVFSYSTAAHHRAGEIITGLPSESVQPAGSAVLGLEALSLHDGRLNGVWGLLGTPDTRTAEGPGAAVLGQVGHISWSGQVTPYGDIASFETATYGSGQESDPYDLITGRYGTVVANAGGTAVQGDFGGNDVELVGRDGSVTQLAAFPQRLIDGNEIESVPTTVAQGPDGAFYVGELEGYPYPVGQARIWRVVPGHAPTVVATGLTNIIDMIFDRHGDLIVLEIAKNSLLDPDQTGALIKISPDGRQTLLASTGMTNPGGVVQVGGAFYVTNNTSSTNGTGELLKITVPGEQ